VEPRTSFIRADRDVVPSTRQHTAHVSAAMQTDSLNPMLSMCTSTVGTDAM
jgi:hypothetical protein